MNLFYRDFKYQLKRFKFPMLAMILVYAFMLFLSTIGDKNVSLFINFFNNAYIDIGIIDTLDEFFIPNHWLLLHLIPVTSLILIIVKDHYDSGIYILMKVKHKTKYFYSKIIASTLINLLIVGVFVLALFIIENFNNYHDLSYNLFFLRIMTCLVLENAILTFIGVMIALKFSTRLSLFFLILDLSLAMLSNFPYILGQASLAFKQDFLGGPYNLSSSMLFLLATSLITLVISYFYFKKYNFYGDEK